jgi:hypothetical protein
MKAINRLIMVCLLITFVIGQEQEFKLKDGTKIKGTILGESETELVVQTSFGAVTINRDNLILKEFKIKMLSGEIFKGTKQSETETEILFNTNIGTLRLDKSKIASIEEVNKASSTGYVHRQRQRGLFGLLNNISSTKDTDFSLGEEQLIDLFFDPTGYTLDQGTLYLSGLSFGFGISDKLQITTKWSGFFWGDINFRPKFEVFKKGNWEKQQALSIGAHYHTRWMPNRYEWKSGSLMIDGDEKYWGGFYKLGENPNYTYEESNNEWNDNCCINDEREGDGNFVEMIELFGAFTTSSARPNLKGRTSHTLGGNIQYVTLDGTQKTFYRAYYGLDVDINPKLKMIGEIFYDPNYLELWQMGEYGNHDYWDIDSFSEQPVEKPTDFNPIHLDFGFVYAVNESFRFGFHFQKPFIAFYWKI